MTIRDHKWEAAESIGRHLGIVALIMIVHNIVIDFAFPLIAPAFVIGLSSVALTLQQGIKPEFSQLWKGFEYYGKSFWLYYSCRLISLLWGLLFIVPGIIKWYSYSMAPFIMAENPTLTVRDARSMSVELTQEYKLRIFLLDLSFIGWYVVAVGALALLKAGMILLAFVLAIILSLCLTPYMMTARADLYQYLKTQKDDETLRNLGKKDAEEADSIDDAYWFPITPEMQKKWHDRHQKIKNTIIITGASVLLIAFAVCGWTIYKIKVKDQIPALMPDTMIDKFKVDVVREYTGYMWWNDDEYEPEQVTVKLNGYIEDGTYYGTVVVLGDKGVLYDFGDVQYMRYASELPMPMYRDRSYDISVIHSVAYTLMDNRNTEVIIATGKNMWNTSYQYIGENYKTEQYSNKLHQINIIAPASSYEDAIEKYNEALNLKEGQKMTIDYTRIG